MIDPLVTAWGWEIPVYLFLGGIVAGMMVITGFFLVQGRHRHESCVCRVLPALGIVLLSLGMLALFLDLEHKAYVWRLYTTVELSSPMSWGAWILLLVYPALALAMLVRLPDVLRVGLAGRLANAIDESPSLSWSVGTANMVLGALLGVYTGVLLSALGARPFWNSAALGLLFLLSGMSAAAAFVHMIAWDRSEREALARADNMFIALELVVLMLFLVGLLTAGRSHATAAQMVLGGPFTAVFWVLVVAFGLVIPFVMQSLAIAHRTRHSAIVPLLVIAGSLALRVVFVYAGQYSHWL
jgi:protein NrfD